MLWLGVFFVAPMFFLGQTSLEGDGWSNYVDVFRDYSEVIRRTFWYAFLATLDPVGDRPISEQRDPLRGDGLVRAASDDEAMMLREGGVPRPFRAPPALVGRADALARNDNSWWLWVSVAGTVLGACGIVYCRRRAASRAVS